MTLPNNPQPGSQGQWSPPSPEGRWSPDQAPVAPAAPVSMSSPLAAIVAPKRGTSALNLLLGLGLVVAIGGVAFASGRLTAPAAAAAGNGTGTGFGRGGNGTGFTPGASGAPGGAGFGGGGVFGAGGAVTIQGTVQAVTPTSISLTPLPFGGKFTQ